MKNLILSILFLILTFSSKELWAQKGKDLSKSFGIVSVLYSVPDNEQQHFADASFKFAWTTKAPYKIGIQFVNHGYDDHKIKFAIKDMTSKKMVIIDAVHNSRFGTELLKANSEGTIWSGLIDDNKDSFSLHVWDSDGDEFDKVPISISDQQ